MRRGAGCILANLMPAMTEDQRIALANMHALALATLRAPDGDTTRAYLDEVAELSPDALPLDDDDPRSDAKLAAGVSPAPAARQLAARVRGVVLGAGVHRDTVTREVALLAREVVGSVIKEKQLEARAVAAMEAVREDLVYDVVRLGSAQPWPKEKSKRADWTRRWGVMRTLELNAFVATLTRDGTNARGTAATRNGADGLALRFALAVVSAAMSLAHGDEPDKPLVADIKRTERALPALLASVIRATRG